MRINLNNTYFPKPLLNQKSDDFVNNNFNIKIVNQDFDKANQKLVLSIETSVDNKFVEELIKKEIVFPVLHIEQKTQRDVCKLSINEITKKVIDLYQYATTDPIEIVGILYCMDNFTIKDYKELNSIYSLMEEEIHYERGDILGFSNELTLNLPEDRRIGSIFNLVKDVDNVLKKTPFKVMLNGELIQILINEDLHQKYVEIYNKDPFVKKTMFSTLVIPAILTALNEMFISYQQFQDKKWCKTIALKIEREKQKRADELFTEDNFDLEKLYEYLHIVIGDLYKDAINTYYLSLEVQ